jgi:hypothetical protein
MRLLCYALFSMTLLTASLAAQDATSDQTTQKVKAASEAFLDQIVAEDFAAERPFLAARLAASVSPEEWAAVRQQTIGISGKTQRYSVHGITYYQQDGLLAAVDFSGAAGLPDTFICGFMLWEVPDNQPLGLLRFEENVVPVAVFRQLPVAEAAQTMVNWRCPTALVESTLNIKLQ